MDYLKIKCFQENLHQKKKKNSKISVYIPIKIWFYKIKRKQKNKNLSYYNSTSQRKMSEIRKLECWLVFYIIIEEALKTRVS